MFSQRKNKRFSYKPRLQDSKKAELKGDVETKWKEARGGAKNKGNVFTSLPALILVLVALFVLIYILNGYMK